MLLSASVSLVIAAQMCEYLPPAPPRSVRQADSSRVLAYPSSDDNLHTGGRRQLICALAGAC